MRMCPKVRGAASKSSAMPASNPASRGRGKFISSSSALASPRASTSGSGGAYLLALFLSHLSVKGSALSLAAALVLLLVLRVALGKLHFLGHGRQQFAVVFPDPPEQLAEFF